MNDRTMLSTTSQYALRALVRLASEPGGGAVLGRDLAKECDIPANYLSKLLWQLRNAGLVSTVRGSGGGYKLDRPAGEIRLMEVVEVFEGLRHRPTCLLGKGECSDAEACSAHHAWKKLRATYIEFLGANTLADIAPRADSGEKASRLSGTR
ncbi:MAG: Rrf2 family transcriptional regulator [Bryobacterales bacterium]|nr:Rrf2 family transcriptional regulator [Bryobacterales bacterium]